MEKNNPKVARAWCMYDWANSVYSLVITTAIFPIYYVAITTQANGTDWVNFLGWQVSASVLYKYALTGAFLAIALVSPILTAIADYGGNKKAFMRFFCYMGSFACMGLYFFELHTFSVSVILFMVAAIGYSGSIVFYNAYLPEIATEDQFDKLSARGFSLGYIGSMLLLVFSLALVLTPETFGITEKSMAPRLSFLFTGLWWFGFAHYTFAYLPKNPYHKKPEGDYLFNGFKELRQVWEQLKSLPALKRFLLAFFFYNMGVQTVMYVASLFGSKELHLPDDALIMVLLIIQGVAIGGAYGFAWLSSRLGNIRSLMIAVLVWVGISIAAYFITTGNQFYMLAFVVGAVMGGIQALSRSTYSKLLPQTTDHASFFSFYDICDKVGLALGSLVFGITEQWFGSMRNSVLVLSVFFIFGLIVLASIRSKKTEPQPQFA
ncbi:MFS transporter [Adhaeribacter sp. BT258]|uniref:MFS transporter n=1 Tax=Adhaeribacter terrigena TaxID=2793070 RepID=A0ABS1C3D9_9BACT|nr:MFS transporter [Adhaeribacter terrigena]MBK0403860.1 MFS transporter [Adhaeribacter terrigena]